MSYCLIKFIPHLISDAEYAASDSEWQIFFKFPGEQEVMFNQREIITAIEIGSSKIVVLIGEFSPNQHHSGVTTAEDMVKIIGLGEVAAPDQAVIKGDIVDMKLTSEALEEAIRSASQNSGVRILNSSAVAVVFSGCDIASQNYAGHVFINNPELKITRNDIINAIKNAKVQVPMQRNIIHSMDSYHILDKVRKVKQPENQVARELDSMVHIIHGDNCRISNFINLLQSSGFEENVSLVFSGIADLFGILSSSQRENGALVIDFGAGCTEYFTVYNDAVTSSGMIPVGMEHVANDLSLAFDVNIKHFRKILADGSLSRTLAGNQEYLEHFAGKNRIPCSSINKVINARIRELMQIIYHSIVDAEALGNINSGAFISGGGALLPNTGSMFREVFEMPYLVAQPFNYASRGGINIDSPRYSAVWGALKYAQAKLQEENSSENGFVGSLTSGIDRIWSGAGIILKTFKGFRV